MWQNLERIGVKRRLNRSQISLEKRFKTIKNEVKQARSVKQDKRRKTIAELTSDFNVMNANDILMSHDSKIHPSEKMRILNFLQQQNQSE